MQTTVSDLIVHFLQRLDLEVVFGMPGARFLPIYDGLCRSALRTVLVVEHEQGASFVAGGFARVWHRVSACIATGARGRPTW